MTPRAEEFTKILGRPPVGSIERRRQDLLHDMKWQKLTRLARWFCFVPFIDFVFVSGSMALGNVTPKSDFDMLVGTKEGKIFTARYFAIALFELLRVRRMDDKPDSSPDKLCFNHFVTPSVYAKPPYNAYRKELYRNLVPVFGTAEHVKAFFDVNGWCGGSGNMDDMRYVPEGQNRFGKMLEYVLGGKFGDVLENRIFAPFAKQRLQKYVGAHPSGRVVISDTELEFHFRLPYEV